MSQEAKASPDAEGHKSDNSPLNHPLNGENLYNYVQEDYSSLLYQVLWELRWYIKPKAFKFWLRSRWKYFVFINTIAWLEVTNEVMLGKNLFKNIGDSQLVLKLLHVFKSVNQWEAAVQVMELIYYSNINAQ